MIDKAIRSIKEKLLDIVTLVRKKDMPSYLNLDSPRRRLERQQSFKIETDFKRQQDKSLIGVWDDRFTGVRYVKLKQIPSLERWDLPILHLENRANAQAALQ